ncbi:hypothetical protein ACFYWS_17795 [Streptomyces sp. NPDC002795]
MTSGQVGAPKGARLVGTEDGKALYDVGPGTWTFRSAYDTAD